MALKKVKTEAGHKRGATGRKSLHRVERKAAARKHRRRRSDELLADYVRATGGEPWVHGMKEGD